MSQNDTGALFMSFAHKCHSIHDVTSVLPLALVILDICKRIHIHKYIQKIIVQLSIYKINIIYESKWKVNEIICCTSSKKS